VASFPSLNEVQLESFRGKESFQSSIDTLKTLNEMGYGKEKTGLELDLVVNPSGSFLPPSQAETENKFHRIIKQKWGIRFNRLYTFQATSKTTWRNLFLLSTLVRLKVSCVEIWYLSRGMDTCLTATLIKQPVSFSGNGKHMFRKLKILLNPEPPSLPTTTVLRVRQVQVLLEAARSHPEVQEVIPTSQRNAEVNRLPLVFSGIVNA
tara:strand:+ start:897 stop:1517 length:621 start_codon:yes stop_codon:yes gene_type:complete